MDYFRRGMCCMPECAYPIDYHRRYGYMYPDMETEIEDEMVYPIMYPEIYYRVYPYVSRICDRMDRSYVLYPSEAEIEDMVNECYDTCMREMPDLEEYVNGNVPMQNVDVSQRIRRPIFRDLISIILISELFRRRRRRRRDRRDRRYDDRYWY